MRSVARAHVGETSWSILQTPDVRTVSASAPRSVHGHAHRSSRPLRSRTRGLQRLRRSFGAATTVTTLAPILGAAPELDCSFLGAAASRG
jgi:hypothetical protein